MNMEPQNEKFLNYKGNHMKKSYSIISLITLIIVLSIWLVISFKELTLSFKAYDPIKGLNNSPWVGFKNFKDLFSLLHFSNVLKNTAIFSLLFCSMSFVISLIIGHIIIKLPKENLLRDVLTVLCIFPLFLPAEVYTRWFISILGSNLFVNPHAMRFLHPLLCSIKCVGIPIILQHILDKTLQERDSLISVKISALFSLTSLIFAINSCSSLTRAVYNPFTYKTLDMIDSFIFRKSLLEMNMELASALGVIHTCILLIYTLIIFIPIKLLFLSTFKKVKIDTTSENITKNVLSSIIALFIFIVIYFLPYIFKGQPFDISIEKMSLTPAIKSYLVLSLFSALIAVTLAVIISWSFINFNNKIVSFAVILLSLLTILTAKPINISQYLIIKKMGLLNTSFSIILTTCFSAALVWAIACITKAEEDISHKSLFTAIVGVFLIEAAIIYCNSTPSILYLNNANLSPTLIFKQLSLGMESIKELNQRLSFNNTIGFYGFIISLPSILLFLISKIIIFKRPLVSTTPGVIEK